MTKYSLNDIKKLQDVLWPLLAILAFLGIFLFPGIIKDIKRDRKLRENGAYATAVIVQYKPGRRAFCYYRYTVNGKKYIAKGCGYKGAKVGDSTKIIYYVPDPNIRVILDPGQDSF
ncbi:MAG: hypothetical protein FWG84_02960 [Bacteroidales bacterium]|nr:hypothetical protein [Bacteroidales bacterium]